jgi:hypothetical protein
MIAVFVSTQMTQIFWDLRRKDYRYTVAGRAIGFALEQPLHVVALP